MKRFFIVNEAVRARAIEAVRMAPQGWSVALSEPKRTLDQNAAMWPVLDAFASQLQWPVNGRMTQMTQEEWKDVLTAAFEQEQRVAQGLNGGFVFLGQRTSQYSKQRFSEFLEFLHATAADRGVML